MSDFEYMVLCLLSGVVSELSGLNGSHGRALFFAGLAALWGLLAVIAAMSDLVRALS